MRYKIRHTTRYSYDQPVHLEPSTIRLRPQANGMQLVFSHQMRITPTPAGQTQVVDEWNNSTATVWFDMNTPLDYLSIVTASDIDVQRDNPFDFIFDNAFFDKLPAQYTPQQQIALKATLDRNEPAMEITELAYSIAKDAQHDLMQFLMNLNALLNQQIIQTIRHHGDPTPPLTTWQTKRGACRDIAVLFIDICRSVGLAARFASGYAYGLIQENRPEMHAWAEVFLPGGGWRGLDPTMGLAVSDKHITLATGPAPIYAAPFAGTFRGTSSNSHLMYDISITPVEPSQSQSQTQGS